MQKIIRIRNIKELREAILNTDKKLPNVNSQTIPFMERKTLLLIGHLSQMKNKTKRITEIYFTEVSSSETESVKNILDVGGFSCLAAKRAGATI